RSTLLPYTTLFRSILPVAVLGSSGRNSIQRGYLNGASRCLTNVLSSSASDSDGSWPCLSTTYALGLTSSSSSKSPTTADSKTAGCAISAFSTSTGETH